MSAQPMPALVVLDAEIKRADASAQSTASAYAHSLRDEKGRAQQRETAEKAQARANDLRGTRSALVELVAAVKAEREARAAVVRKNELLRSGEAHPEDYHPGADAPDGISEEQRHVEAYRRVTNALALIQGAPQ